MISMYRDLNKGKSIKSLVLKQIVGGVLLLILAMLSESLLGYYGTLGGYFRHLGEPWNFNSWGYYDPDLYNWTPVLYRWNTFETVHTIAWCLIINGCVQGLLSLKGNWKNTKKMIFSYSILAVLVVILNLPIWFLIYKIVPGYPFNNYLNGHNYFQPWIGYESFWHILRAPFLAALAAPMEPIFPL